MAKFLTTAGTISAIEEIINTARNNIVLISPYVKVPATLYQNLSQADVKGVSITMIYGKNKMMDLDVKRQLEKLKHCSIYFLENLHAKCYFNEDSMVITSMNLYDFSERNNREMGILLTLVEDSDIYNNTYDEYKRILGLSQVIPTGTRDTEPLHAEQTKQPPKKLIHQESFLRRPISELFGPKKGHCIRCGSRIDYDLNEPLCKECNSYVQPKDKTYKGVICFYCGKTTISTIANPLCDSCNNRLRRRKIKR